MRISWTALKACQVKVTWYAAFVSFIWEESEAKGTREPDKGEKKETEKKKKLNGTEGGTTGRGAGQLYLDDVLDLEIVSKCFYFLHKKVSKKQKSFTIHKKRL